MELEADKKRRMLIFCNSTEQADRVCTYSYHTKNAQEGYLDKFNNGDIHKIAVCGKIDRGVNLNSVNTAILEYVTRSETKAVQKLGRGKRLNVDELLDVYILIPYYKKFGSNKPYPTVVLSKVQEACKNLGIENAKTYIVKT
jgi:superfamily II DNA or RNA helicase